MPVQAGERVLIADADPGVRRQLYKRLLEANIFSDSVADGRAALESLRKRPYSVILLDLDLPLVGADQILGFVQNHPDAGRPVILVTSNGACTRTLDVDLVQVVLRKPCNLPQLAELIQSCVRTATAHRDATRPAAEQIDGTSAVM